MTITILYFAGLREALGSSRESVALPAGVDTAGALRAWLRQRGGAWAEQRIRPCGQGPRSRSSRRSPAAESHEGASMPIRVQQNDFDAGAEIAALRAGRRDVGAVASFIGTVRDLSEGEGVSAMTLEHYPGMTERALEDICAQARARWDILDTLVVHRFGELAPGDQIVLVAVTSAHRGESFAACEFIMDYLKTQAPFWKKERTPTGERWVEARASDDEAAARW
jgi:molybdopterin synthase catalytic subunit